MTRVTAITGGGAGPVASRVAALVVALVALAALQGCSDGAAPGAEGVPSTEEFVSTYVDLRISALRTTSGEIRAEDRDSILAARGVTDADLFAFVDAHGRDATFMQTVWDSVEVRLNRVRDSVNTSVRGPS